MAFVFFFKQKTAYEMRISDWSSDVCSSDLPHRFTAPPNTGVPSGHDLDGDGRTMGPRDALGYGRFPGQYGMAILSRPEQRRGGNMWVSTCRTRWSPYHEKKKKTTTKKTYYAINLQLYTHQSTFTTHK